MKQKLLLPWFLIRLFSSNLFFVIKIIFSLMSPYKYYLASFILLFSYGMFLFVFSSLNIKNDQTNLKTNIVKLPQDSQIQIKEIKQIKGSEKLELAQQNLLKINSLSPTHLDTLKNLYLVSLYQGRQEQAQLYLEEIKSFSPNQI